jgi:hypothetical protein
MLEIGNYKEVPYRTILLFRKGAACRSGPLDGFQRNVSNDRNDCHQVLTDRLHDAIATFSSRTSH